MGSKAGAGLGDNFPVHVSHGITNDYFESHPLQEGGEQQALQHKIVKRIAVW